jgi:VanZ family protein
MQHIIKYQKLTLGWALFILVICNVDLGSTGKSSLFFPGFDKLVHCGLFFMFTALVNYGLIRQSGNLKWGVLVIVVVTAVLFGALIEILQMYIFTWRGAEWGDLFADSVGIGMAAFCSLITVIAIRDEKKQLT